jgi:addiction module HigA family antidote
VIRSFRGPETEQIFRHQRSRRFQAVAGVAKRKLDQLDSATSLRDLAALPGNRLEALAGDRMGQYSIRVNEQWRICFRWKDGKADDVEIVVYHGRGGEYMASRKAKKIPPMHPGETIREDVLKPLGLSVNRLAMDLHVPVTRMSEIVNSRRSITADTALRLARYLGTSAQFWLNLQAKYDLEIAEDELAARIENEVRPRRAA